MVFMLARHTVESYEKPKATYDEYGDMRKGHGSIGARIFRNVNEPAEIFVLGEWREQRELRKYFNSGFLQRALESVGLKKRSDVWVVEEIDTAPS